MATTKKRATKKKVAKKATEPKEVSIKPDLKRYKSGRAASGAVTRNCDDAVAKLTAGFTVRELFALVGKVRDDVTAADLEQRYANLKNDGMRIMNARNLLRKAYKADANAVTNAAKPTQAAAAKRLAAAKAPKGKKKAA